MKLCAYGKLTYSNNGVVTTLKGKCWLRRRFRRDHVLRIDKRYVREEK
jgi:hypothetical protein